MLTKDVVWELAAVAHTKDSSETSDNFQANGVENPREGYL